MFCYSFLLRLPQPLHNRLLSNHTIDHKRNPRADHGKDQCRKHDRTDGILKPEKPEHFSIIFPINGSDATTRISEMTIAANVYNSPSYTSIRFNWCLVIPTDCSTANSLRLAIIPVRMAFRKFNVPTTAITPERTPPSSRNIPRNESNSFRRKISIHSCTAARPVPYNFQKLSIALAL